MEEIRRLGMDDALEQRVAADRPLLGICLGMQLLFEGSSELGGAEGLGLLPARSSRSRPDGLKLPQIGWNEVRWSRPAALNDRASRPLRPLPRALVRGGPERADVIAGRRPTARPSQPPSSAMRSGACSSTPRSPGPRGSRLLSSFVAACANGRSARGMILLPAIDIRDGKAVRLEQGRFDREQIYVDDPLEAARAWREAGARFLHVVDLDGAREGEPVNLEHLRRITSELDVPVQYGGGLRTQVAVRDALAAGADRVVLGTAAYTDSEFLDSVVDAWNARVLVAIDVREDNVSVAGWTKATQMPATEVIERMQRRGVRRFVYTSVDRDGMLGGPDLDEVRRVAETVRGRFIYSGGIGSLDDLRALRDLRLVNLSGVISGKALYEQHFTIAEAQEALAETG